VVESSLSAQGFFVWREGYGEFWWENSNQQPCPSNILSDGDGPAEWMQCMHHCRHSGSRTFPAEFQLPANFNQKSISSLSPRIWTPCNIPKLIFRLHVILTFIFFLLFSILLLLFHLFATFAVYFSILCLLSSFNLILHLLSPLFVCSSSLFLCSFLNLPPQL